MKKILFLLLLPVMAVAQIPMPKSTTTFSNVRATGAMTVTGRATLSSTINTMGNTTWNTNQTNTLTTGNTGTVAVLSDALYQTTFSSYPGSTLADASNYYYGTLIFNNTTTANLCRQYAPYNMTLIGYQVNIFNNISSASAESATLAIVVNGSSTNLATNITCSTTINTFTSNVLSQSINGGNFYEAKLITPTYATNSVGTQVSITFLFARRK